MAGNNPTTATIKSAMMPVPLQTAPPVADARRRYDIDALRIAAVLLLIYFHTACVFMQWPFHIQNLQRSRAATLFVVFLGQWHMPLFFLLAGASTWLALEARSGRQYFAERIRRLLVPAIFGILLVVPPQVYVERISSWIPTRQSPIDFHGSYLAFYPHFFEGTYPTGNFSWHHLWFIVYLFVYSVVTLPVFLWLKTRPYGRRCVHTIANVLSPGRRLFLLAVPGIALAFALQRRFPATHALLDDWHLHAQYILLFLYGGLFAADDRLVLAAVRHRRTALLLALVLTPTLLWPAALPHVGGVTGYVIMTIAGGLNTCSWLILILGLGRRYLDRPLPGLRYAGRIAYPFYILHQTVIVVLAYYVLRWNAGVGVKYLVISTAALLLTIGLCDLVRRSAITRFMFGMAIRTARPNRSLESACACGSPWTCPARTTSRPPATSCNTSIPSPVPANPWPLSRSSGSPGPTLTAWTSLRARTTS